MTGSLPRPMLPAMRRMRGACTTCTATPPSGPCPATNPTRIATTTVGTIAVLEDQKVVRGGSFFDRPQRCRSAFRLSYPSWQRVHNVGFRVVCEGEAPGVGS